MGGWLAGKQIQHQHGTTDLEGLFSLAPATPEGGEHHAVTNLNFSASLRSAKND